MAEKIFLWGVIAILGLLFIGGIIYFIIFMCFLLSELKGFTAIIAIAFAVFLICSTITLIKGMFC